MTPYAMNLRQAAAVSTAAAWGVVIRLIIIKTKLDRFHEDGERS